jgi:anti-anti-sigma factor
VIVRRDAPEMQLVVALNLELSHGRHGASARVEIHERNHEGGAGRVARVALHGWLDAIAVRRLETALHDLAARGADQVVLDCSGLRHIAFRQTAALLDALERVEAHGGGILVCGRSRHLRDLFRLAGCEARMRSGPGATELLEARGERLEPSGAATS